MLHNVGVKTLIEFIELLREFKKHLQDGAQLPSSGARALLKERKDLTREQVEQLLKAAQLPRDAAHLSDSVDELIKAIEELPHDVLKGDVLVESPIYEKAGQKKGPTKKQNSDIVGKSNGSSAPSYNVCLIFPFLLSYISFFF